MGDELPGDAMSSVSCSPIRISLVDWVSHDLAFLHTKVLAMALVVIGICRFCRYVYVSMYGYGQRYTITNRH
jgi:hypothetical protein